MEVWNFIKYSIEVLSRQFCKIFKDIYFANVCEDLPLKNKIFTRVFFCKILGFYYKWNRQLFYYEGTLSYVPLKILERVNRVIFQNSFEFFWIPSEYTSKDKNMFKVDNKECFRDVIRLFL